MNIQPLGEQLIIRTIPVDSVGSIIIPDSAKGITQKGSGGDMDAVHFVEAEVEAVGPGKRVKDQRLMGDMAYVLETFLALSGLTRDGTPAAFVVTSGDETRDRQTSLNAAIAVLERIDRQCTRIPPIVKPGDRILYHPAVQRFDRDITDVMQNGDNLNGSKYFIIREDSVLAVIKRD